MQLKKVYEFEIIYTKIEHVEKLDAIGSVLTYQEKTIIV